MMTKQGAENTARPAAPSAGQVRAALRAKPDFTQELWREGSTADPAQAGLPGRES
jgi:hypothetical protein